MVTLKPPFDNIPETERIRLIDEALSHPRCPFPPELIRSLTRQAKLAVFDKLAEAGAIKRKGEGNYGEKTNNRPLPEEKIRTVPRQSETAQVNKDYTNFYSIVGSDLQKDTDVAISQKARLQGLYIIGANGTGKSTLLANLILTDIQQGLGVCLIEPHGDLTKTIIAGLPENRVKDVILLNVEDVDYPFGINLYECPLLTIRDMAQTASFVSHVFEKIWYAGTETPRLMQNLRALTRTLIENPGATFAEIPLLYSNDTVRTNFVANLSNPSIISYWQDYERKNQRDRAIYLESTLNKVNAFLDEPMIRNIFAQSKTSIDFRALMDSGKILLVKLSPQFEEASRLIGAVIIGKLLMAAFSRTEQEEQNRRQFHLYCDEFQRFATSDFATLISEARKFKIATTLSHQTLSQVDEANRAAALAAGNLIVCQRRRENLLKLALLKSHAYPNHMLSRRRCGHGYSIERIDFSCENLSGRRPCNKVF